ncbi:MAG: FecR family protein [Hyphomicrobiales bacterium]
MGVNAAVQGDVFVIGVKKKISRRAKVRDAVFIGDAITTKRQSALQVLLLDETIFTVGQSCRLVIDRFVYDPERGNGEVAASVARGAFRFMTGKIGKARPSSVQLKTPASTIGIRGTIAEGAVGSRAVKIAQALRLNIARSNSKQATIIVLRGPGRGRNSFDRIARISVSSGAHTVDINRPGWAVFVPFRGAEPIGPVRFNREAYRYLDIRLRSKPRAPGIRPLDIEQKAESLSAQDKFNTLYRDMDPAQRERNELIFDRNHEHNLRKFEEYQAEQTPPSPPLPQPTPPPPAPAPTPPPPANSCPDPNIPYCPTIF